MGLVCLSVRLSVSVCCAAMDAHPSRWIVYLVSELFSESSFGVILCVRNDLDTSEGHFARALGGSRGKQPFENCKKQQSWFFHLKTLSIVFQRAGCNEDRSGFSTQEWRHEDRNCALTFAEGSLKQKQQCFDFYRGILPKKQCYDFFRGIRLKKVIAEFCCLFEMDSSKQSQSIAVFRGIDLKKSQHSVFRGIPQKKVNA